MDYGDIITLAIIIVAMIALVVAALQSWEIFWIILGAMLIFSSLIWAVWIFIDTNFTATGTVFVVKDYVWPFLAFGLGFWLMLKPRSK